MLLAATLVGWIAAKDNKRREFYGKMCKIKKN